MYKLITSSRGTEDLSIGFDRSRDRRNQELTNNKNIKSKFNVRIILKDVFGFSQCMEKATYGLGYKLTLTRSSDRSVLNKTNATNIGIIQINVLDWYVPLYTPSISQQSKLSKQISSV